MAPENGLDDTSNTVCANSLGLQVQGDVASMYFPHMDDSRVYIKLSRI